MTYKLMMSEVKRFEVCIEAESAKEATQIALQSLVQDQHGNYVIYAPEGRGVKQLGSVTKTVHSTEELKTDPGYETSWGPIRKANQEVKP